MNIDHLLGGGWPAEYEEKMVNYMQEEEEDDPMRKVSSTPSSVEEEEVFTSEEMFEISLDS